MLRRKIIGVILLCYLYSVAEEKEILFQSNKLFCFGGRVNVVLMLLNMEKHIRKLCRKKYLVKKIYYRLKFLQIHKNFRR